MKKRKINIRLLLISIIIPLIIVIAVIYIQLNGQSTIKQGCSYLDPITIDILAFLAALFLIIEGFFRIIEDSNVSLTRNSLRIIRISLGFSILTLHTIQFLHK